MPFSFSFNIGTIESFSIDVESRTPNLFLFAYNIILFFLSREAIDNLFSHLMILKMLLV